MAKTLLASVLVKPTIPVPLYLRNFEIEVDFAPSYDAENDHEVLQDAIQELQDALRQGFFAWSFLPSRQSAKLSLEWLGTKGFVLRGEAAGVHHNVLVAALRLIVCVHHTPAAAHENAKAALGDAADALSPRSIFSEIVTGIRISALEGTDGRVSARNDFEAYLADTDISLPKSGLFSDVTAPCEEDRIVVAADTISQEVLDDVEDVFLRVCDSSCFRSLSMIDELGGDAELFLRSGKSGGRELVIDDYADEYYGLIELLNCLSLGRVATLSVSSGE
jgi:hypothetical protein